MTVALDFGTAFSGFAHAHATDPARIHSFYVHPKAGGGGRMPKPQRQAATNVDLAQSESEVKAEGVNFIASQEVAFPIPVDHLY